MSNFKNSILERLKIKSGQEKVKLKIFIEYKSLNQKTMKVTMESHFDKIEFDEIQEN